MGGEESFSLHSVPEESDLGYPQKYVYATKMATRNFSERRAVLDNWTRARGGLDKRRRVPYN